MCEYRMVCLTFKITHWQHPHFHAYFPAGNSYPSILGEMLASGLGIVGFSWAASPACTELETIVLFWLGKMLGLPKELLPFGEDSMKQPSATNGTEGCATNGLLSEHNDDNNANSSTSPPQFDYSDDDDVILPNHTGGAVLLATASECVLVSMLSARSDILHKLRAKHPFVEDGILISKLVAYTSKLVGLVLTGCAPFIFNVDFVCLGSFLCGKGGYDCHGQNEAARYR